MNINEIVATNTRVFMGIKGINATEMSEQLGMSKTTITAITNGTFNGVQNNTLNKIAGILEIEVFELFMPIERFYYKGGNNNVKKEFNEV